MTKIITDPYYRPGSHIGLQIRIIISTIWSMMGWRLTKIPYSYADNFSRDITLIFVGQSPCANSVLVADGVVGSGLSVRTPPRSRHTQGHQQQSLSEHKNITLVCNNCFSILFIWEVAKKSFFFLLMVVPLRHYLPPLALMTRPLAKIAVFGGFPTNAKCKKNSGNGMHTA